MKYDLVGAMIDYEYGEFDMAKTIELFQYLKDYDLLDKLQGSYGRMAEALYTNGLIK